MLSSNTYRLKINGLFNSKCNDKTKQQWNTTQNKATKFTKTMTSPPSTTTKKKSFNRNELNENKHQILYVSRNSVYFVSIEFSRFFLTVVECCICVNTHDLLFKFQVYFRVRSQFRHLNVCLTY